jgi:hypothetical protein
MVRLASQDPGLTVFVASGEVTASGVVEAYEDFLRSPTSNVLWDLSGARIAGIETKDVRHVAHSLATMEGASRRPGGKTAILCGRPAGFGVARMLQTYLDIEGYGPRVVAFTDGARALDWLTGRLED